MPTSFQVLQKAQLNNSLTLFLKHKIIVQNKCLDAFSKKLLAHFTQTLFPLTFMITPNSLWLLRSPQFPFCSPGVSCASSARQSDFCHSQWRRQQGGNLWSTAAQTRHQKQTGATAATPAVAVCAPLLLASAGQTCHQGNAGVITKTHTEHTDRKFVSLTFSRVVTAGYL